MEKQEKDKRQDVTTDKKSKDVSMAKTKKDVTTDKNSKDVAIAKTKKDIATDKKSKDKVAGRKKKVGSTDKRKKVIAVLAIVIVAILAISGVLSLVGTIGANINLEYAKGNKAVENNGLVPVKDELGYWTFTKKDDTNFKILQLTDIHIGNGFMAIAKDRKALNAIKKIVSNTKPDLIIVTGDMVYPIPIQSGTTNNRRATELFATFMDGFEIPWAITYGNHDEEWFSVFTLADIAEVYEAAKYCIYQRGPEDIMGMSNYFINIKNTDGSLNTSLVLIDSNSYAEKMAISVYDKIHDDQVEWYERQLKNISQHYGVNGLVPSLGFWHIPLNEYEDAYKLYKQGSDQVEYHFGGAGEPQEQVCAPKYRGKMFDKMVELGSTKGVFCGHDHLNDFSITYKGIRLTYGKSIDYLAYVGVVKGFTKMDDQRGGTVIEIDNNSNFEVTSLKLRDIA